ncbi:DUF4255 domain-containing protein [Mycolicibacterium psychrotolerans]|uniref:Pvc16 N-terminal domain-containing protein n=1 Tax=Mycolicibacterium psychrotolerans TaxID=216929 RepID=A0A7I7MDS3_9MYCO|nr:DUF4255 domain-containing protein [Mycolicibacterium psychrotolerans]BBX69950.1 hypothetical protein MPSYJ_34110 [Mycolicibacterium psychrotolerans]
MSSQLALAAVSAVLRNLLDDGMVQAVPAMGAIKVTAIAPDAIKLDDPDLGPSLNLFLYRVSPNQGWQNGMLPAYGPNGGRTSNPPLALNLHLLLTAYGASDFQAEILLGYAMSILHEHPVLDRAMMHRALTPTALGPSILPPAFQALAASDLADQVEAVTLTLEPLDTEGMSRLWSAIQSHYRPTAAYIASVVLIEVKKPVSTGLPVLSRGPVDPVTGDDAGVFVHPDTQPPLPTLFTVSPPDKQLGARLGDKIRLDGVHLDGSSVDVLFAHPLLTEPRLVTVGTNDVSALIDVDLPTGGAAEQQWPAGIWTVTVRLLVPGETVPRITNGAAMMLAPEPVLSPAPTVARDAGTGRVTVTLGVRPEVRPSQTATLGLGTAVAPADARATAASTLTFQFGVVPDGQQWARLTVDGVESQLVDRTKTPPTFDPTQRIAVPA